MTVEESEQVDLIGIDMQTGKVHLTISDHLPWDADNRHLLLLHKKLNSYLAFVESGEIYTSYPDATGRSCVIDVLLKHEPDGDGTRFLEIAKQTIQDAGIEFRFSTLDDGDDDGDPDEDQNRTGS